MPRPASCADTQDEYTIETHAAKSQVVRYVAIYRVSDKSGNVLFENPDILKEFDTTDEPVAYGTKATQEWIDAQ